MKKYSRLLLLIACFYLPHCGVHVGNGMKNYQSKHGYEFKYSSALTLVEREDGKVVRLDNGEEGFNQDALVSSIQIKVVPERTVTNQQVAEEMRIQVANLVSTEFSLGGRFALKNELPSDTYVTKKIISSNFKNQLVIVDSTAYKAKDGISKINEVISSFKFSRN